MANDLVVTAIENHQFSLDTLHEAYRLAKSAPERVTDVHLQHLAHYQTEAQLQALVARRCAARTALADRAVADAQQRTTDARVAWDRAEAAGIRTGAIVTLRHAATGPGPNRHD